MRLILAALLLAAPSAFADATPAAPACGAAWREGYLKGVADIQAQLAAAHETMQAEVERQLNAQLAHLQTRRDSEIQAQLRAAQQQALEAAVATPMPRALTGGGTAPQPGADRQPNAPSLLIRNPQNLPPELYAALMAYVKGGAPD